jgi:hypothetical protein
MFWVLLYIATKFLAPIPLISLGINDFCFQFPPKSTNSSRRISQKSTNRLNPALRLAKADIPAKAGPPSSAGQHRLATDRSSPPRSRLASSPARSCSPCLVLASPDRPTSPAQLPSLPRGHLRPSSKLQHSARDPAPSRAWLQAPATKPQRQAPAPGHLHPRRSALHRPLAPRPVTAPAQLASAYRLPRSAFVPRMRSPRPTMPTRPRRASTWPPGRHSPSAHAPAQRQAPPPPSAST